MRTWQLSILACSALGAAFLAPTLATAGGSSVVVSKVVVYPDPPPFAPPPVIVGTNLPTPTDGNTSSGSATQYAPPDTSPAVQDLGFSVSVNTTTPYAETYSVNSVGQEVPNGELYKVSGTITITALSDFYWSTLQDDYVKGDYVGPIAGLEFEFPNIFTDNKTLLYPYGSSTPPSTAPLSYYSLQSIALDSSSTAPVSGCASSATGSNCFVTQLNNDQVEFQYYGNPTGLITVNVGTQAQPDDIYENYWAQNQSAVYDFTLFAFTPETFTVPEPGTWALMLIGFAGIGFALRRRTARTAPVVT